MVGEKILYKFLDKKGVTLTADNLKVSLDVKAPEPTIDTPTMKVEKPTLMRTVGEFSLAAAIPTGILVALL